MKLSDLVKVLCLDYSTGDTAPLYSSFVSLYTAEGMPYQEKIVLDRDNMPACISEDWKELKGKKIEEISVGLDLQGAAEVRIYLEKEAEK